MPHTKMTPQQHTTSTHLHVELVVEVLVDLLGVPVLAQQAAQHAQAADPQQLGGQARLARSTALACVRGVVGKMTRGREGG